MRRAGFAALVVTTIGAALAENLLHFPLSVRYMKDLAAGEPILDMRPGYTPADAYHLFDVLGPKGRGAYLRLLWTVDLLLPALFGVFLFSVIRRGVFRAWGSIPLLAAACDYSENVTITILLARYPVQEAGAAQLACVFTVTKLVLYTSGLVLAVAGLLPPLRDRFFK